MRRVYLVEVGVLLPGDSPEYNQYNNVYDCVHAFYDEDQYYVDTLEEAKRNAKKYVEQGVEGTYAVISSSALPDDVDVSEAIVENEHYLMESVVYSLKKENGKLVEDFLEE